MGPVKTYTCNFCNKNFSTFKEHWDWHNSGNKHDVKTEPSSEKEDQSNDQYDDSYVQEDSYEVQEEIIHKPGRPNESKYDEFFEINHITNQATCRTCHKTIRKNCSGMRGHLSSMHQIDIPAISVFQPGRPNESKYDEFFEINHITNQ